MTTEDRGRERDTGDDRIGPTAHYTAYVWHRLGMPYASTFATPLGATLFYGFRALGEGLAALHPTLPSMSQYLEARHRTIEDAVEALRPDVVVELGAGLSRRGVTFAARGVRAVEIDLPPMIALKRRRIAQAGPSLRDAIGDRLALVAADVLDARFEDRLAALLGDAARPVVVAEGLVGYFAMADRERLARAIAGALAGRGAFVSELRHEGDGPVLGAAVGVLKGGIKLVTKGRGTREDFESAAAAERFLRAAGFADVEALPPPAHLAHLHLPTRVWRASGAARR